MIRFIVAYLLLAIPTACSEKHTSLPAGVLPQEKMEAVLWDIIQADQFYHDYIAKDSLVKNVKAERIKLYERVFEMHKVTKPAFDKSFSFYSEHPDLLKELFDSLAAKGSKRVNEVYKPVQPDSAFAK